MLNKFYWSIFTPVSVDITTISKYELRTKTRFSQFSADFCLSIVLISQQKPIKFPNKIFRFSKFAQRKNIIVKNPIKTIRQYWTSHTGT